MLNVIYLRRALRALLLIMWAPMPVYAAALLSGQAGTFSGISALDALGGVSWPLIALAFGLSTLSGATALVWRLDRELSKTADGKLPRLWLFVASNILGSWLAGTFAWLGAVGTLPNLPTTLCLVIVASFAGARVIEKAAEKYIGKE